MDESQVSTLSVLLATSVTLSVILYYRYAKIYSYWKERNVPGPEPMYLFGHLLHFYRDHITDYKMKCTKKFGRVWGYFEGQKPALSIADPEVAVQVCIKDFNVFPNHRQNRLFNHFQKKFLFAQQDDQWRRLRALISPTFTSGKMRKMVKLLEKCVNDLDLAISEQIDEGKSSAVINVKDTYSLYTMDAITTCCYGLKLERVKNTNNLKTMSSRNEFVRDSLKLFEFNIKRLVFMQMIPESLLDLMGFYLTPMSKLMPVITKVSKVIEMRRKSPTKLDDYLQSIMEAKLSNKVELDHLDTQENHHAYLTNDTIQKDQEGLASSVEKDTEKQSNVGFLNEEEIVANAVFLMVVGLETTANLLSATTYALAHHQSIQDRLREEVRKIVSFDEKHEPYVDYASVTSCNYLDAVLSETLRRLPTVNQTDRVNNQDYTIEKYQIFLPADSKITIDIKNIMLSEEYWPNPERFDPERFMPENKDKIVPGSYLPFGIGPRHCVGMRFSLTESKMALARLILKYKFSSVPGTSFPPPERHSLGLRRFDNICVVAERLT